MKEKKKEKEQQIKGRRGRKWIEDGTNLKEEEMEERKKKKKNYNYNKK